MTDDMRNALTDRAFEIIPFVGVGELRFGMTPEEAADILGAPAHVGKTHSGLRVEYRPDSSDFLVTYDKDGKIFHFGFNRGMKCLLFKGIRLFQDTESDVLTSLIKEDDSPHESVGIIMFLKLGMTVSGFHDGDIDQKSISLFRKGELEKKFSQSSHAKPFDLCGRT